MKNSAQHTGTAGTANAVQAVLEARTRKSETPGKALLQACTETVHNIKKSIDKTTRPDSGSVGTTNAVQAVLDVRTHKAATGESVLSLVLKLAATALVVILLFGVVFGIGIVKGDSMFPNLKSGNIVLLSRVDHSYDVGDIVLLRASLTDDYIKRIVAVPGDVVDIDENGALYVNGKLEESEEIFFATELRENDISFPLTIGADEVFVLGDNRTISHDSRELGPIKTKDIVGIVFFYSGTMFG